jgi:ubiquinone/menaquinone biosynthesis C-methylase UbiE
MKTWGKDIWEEKSKNQKGIAVSGGVVNLIRGKKNYFKSMNRTQNEISNFLEKNKKIKNILEVGPGPDAINAIFFLNKGYNLDLVDCSPNTLRLAKEKIGDKKVGLFKQDIIELNIPKKYDLIFCKGTFLHIPQHLALVVMNNFNRHLVKNGYLIIDFPIKHKMTFRTALWGGIYFMGHRIKTKITRKDFYLTCGAYTLEEIDDILKRTKFKKVKNKGLWFIRKIK